MLLPVEAKYLESEYGIKPEDYAPREATTKASPGTTDPMMLYNSVRVIVREEINTALRSDWFREIVQNAQKAAVLIQMEKEREEYRRMITSAVYNTITDEDFMAKLRSLCKIE